MLPTTRIVPALLGAVLTMFALTGGFAADLGAQERTHTVVRGNTLWDLSAAVYGDPFRWPSIWEANRDRVDNPHLIFPGQVLRIPMGDGTVTEVTVVSGDRPSEAEGAVRAGGEPQELAIERMPGTGAFGPRVDERPDRGPRPALTLPAVPDELVAAAPFLVPEGEDDPAMGRVTGYAGAEEIRAPRSSARLYDRMTFEADANVPAGTWLQAYRPGDVVPGVGQVMVPTGLFEVEPVAAGAPVAVLRVQHGALRPGDALRPVPRAGLTPGVAPTAVTDGPQASLVAVARDHELQTVGDYVFLDVGRNATGVGDEWVAVWPTAGEGHEEGRVQVVAVQDRYATARIVNLVNPVFASGVTVRLQRRMPGR
jgi:hypothetical protein